ncbi:mastermind-like domain-containing protein 1 [Arapaima gigas]
MLLVSQRLDAPRMEPQLPGSVKRKLAADEGLRVVNGVSGNHMTHGSSKRPCLEDVTLAMGPSHQHSPFSPAPGVGGHGPLLEGNGLNNNNGLGSPYSVPPKASPGSMAGGGGGNAARMLPSFNSNGSSSAPSVEQELQDILDELTKNPDPSLAELDIEKILGNKGDEQPSGPGGFMQPEGSGTPKRSPQRPSHLESHLTHSPGFSQTPSVGVGSPQIGPPPAGAPYSLPHPAKAVPSPLSASPLSSSAQSHTSSQARSPMLSAALSSRPTPTWHEVSRAQQLQQMASNSKLLPSNAGPSPSQPAPPPVAPQAAPWTGPSPPYRPTEKLPNSSPHQQPFSPAGSTQSPQSALISGMVAAPPKGPSPPYHPEKLASPALAQPPFSPQSTLLPSMASTGGGSNAIQSSQAGVLPGMPPTGTSTRPSPPYRPDKHPSPALQAPPQAHAFSSHTEPSGMTSQLFKAMNSSQPNSLKLLMQQQQNQAAVQPQAHPSSVAQQALGKAGMGQDPYSFTNTKPLCHFDPVLPAQKLSPLPPGQGTLSHYPNPNLQSGPPAVAPGHPQLLQQQQEMQQRMPRNMQTGGMVPVSRVDQSSGMVSRPQDPSSISRPTQGSSYNLMLKNQLMRKHLLQEKQRQMEQMNGNQVPECHQVAQAQGAGQPHPTECGYPMGVPSANPGMLPLGPMLSGRGGLPQGPQCQAPRGVGPFMGGQGPKQLLYNPSQASDFGMPLRPGQSMMGMSVPPRQPPHQMPTRAGMQGPSFPGGSLQSPQPQHLRHALQQGGTVPRVVFNPQQQPQLQAWQQPGVPRMPCDVAMDAGLQHQQQQQQPFLGGGAAGGGGGSGGPHQFSQQSMRPSMPGSFAPHQTVAPAPSQLGPGLPGRHMQKMPAGAPLPPMAPSALRPPGPLSAMAGMKPVPPGMVHRSQGMAPPSYPSSSNKHTLGPGYGGTNPGQKVAPYECVHRQNNGGAPERQGEVDFIDTLVGSNEDWLNNLTMIDEYLEQNS